MTYHEILLVVSSVAIAVVAVFLSIALYQLALTLRDARRVIAKTEDTVDTVTTFVMKPIGIALGAQAALSGFMSKIFGRDDDRRSRRDDDEE